jgi:uncharacterized PurR-regulated membrane protein YhhQ (DUF165 family)
VGVWARTVEGITMKKNVKQYLLVFCFLASIIVANLLAAKFGAKASIIVAFTLIGLDLTVRDTLHEIWHKKNLWLKMLGLIFVGSAVSYLINRDAGPIAIASFLAFLVASLADFIVYTVLYKKKWIVKANCSNIFSSLTDSLVFPTVAFGGFSLLITAGQFLAKFFGGFLWTLILKR